MEAQGRKMQAIKYQRLNGMNSKEGIVMADYRTILFVSWSSLAELEQSWSCADWRDGS